MDSQPPQSESLRERKRRETLARIAETGLQMFIDNGYDATTLEAIAAEAGISARTFFYYFKTKEEILQHFQGSGFYEALRPAILAVSPDQPPLEAVRDVLLGMVSRYETERSIVIDRLLRSNEALRARKQATFALMETTIFEALCEVWPQPERRDEHRMVAILSIGMMRLGMELWRQDGGKRRMADYVGDSFARLQSGV
ncbi:TetR/AcrR family transcriptional regulator [Phyllobacterium myrsinacearum]|uniref:AcrR family transcriptional regulator n=1 Tax=Phyllobacterium myrsinacearum TaxID=28101 RepID=A0A839ER22_9HYPH|nr:TetR/AcrR family transcriptional regulator [Phyllobacterium myrsinacearum]MBA8879050.1 AcrR family transcriptional regulator [Phyllobacterium myrsinacearum]